MPKAYDFSHLNTVSAAVPDGKVPFGHLLRARPQQQAQQQAEQPWTGPEQPAEPVPVRDVAARKAALAAQREQLAAQQADAIARASLQAEHDRKAQEAANAKASTRAATLMNAMVEERAILRGDAPTLTTQEAAAIVTGIRKGA
jgi:hypothetical protein